MNTNANKTPNTETSAANSAATMNPQLKAIVLGSMMDIYHMRKLQPLSGDHGDVVAMQAGLVAMFADVASGNGSGGFGGMDMSLGLYANDTTRDPVQRMVARSVDMPLEVLLELDELDQLDLLYAWIEVNDRFFAQTLPKLMVTLAGMMTKLTTTTKAMQAQALMTSLSTGSPLAKR